MAAFCVELRADFAAKTLGEDTGRVAKRTARARDSPGGGRREHAHTTAVESVQEELPPPLLLLPLLPCCSVPPAAAVRVVVVAVAAPRALALSLGDARVHPFRRDHSPAAPSHTTHCGTPEARGQS
jgi:hypothetical protein